MCINARARYCVIIRPSINHHKGYAIMSIDDNHSLVREFPAMRDQIHRLKQTDGHFARLFADYDAVAQEAHRIESGAEAASDERLEGLKKQRLHLKDQLFSLLKQAA
jgi:uncharacterized protein YdcH (DUF465 family)